MAKIPRHVLKALQRRQSKEMDDQADSFWFAEGTMLSHRLARSNEETVNMPAQTVSRILKRKYHWQFVIFAFCDDGRESYYKVDTITGSDGFGAIKDITPKITGKLNALIDAQNPKHLVSYGWWGSPADVDLDEQIPELVKMFDSYGAFSHDVVKTNVAIRFGRQ